MEEGGGAGIDWGGGNSFYEEEISGGRAGDRCWIGPVGVGVCVGRNRRIRSEADDRISGQQVGPGLFDTELFPRLGAEALWCPGRGPDNIDGAGADAGQLLEAGFNLRADVDVFGATLGGEGHLDGYVLLLIFGRREISGIL